MRKKYYRENRCIQKEGYERILEVTGKGNTYEMIFGEKKDEFPIQ